MAGTVTSNLTNITLAETGDSGSWDDQSGGAGSGQDTNSPIQGSENRSRRIDNAIRWFSFDNTTTIDLSASGTHVAYWLNVFQPGLIGTTSGISVGMGGSGTGLLTNPYRLWIAYSTTGTLSTNNTDVQYPVIGGWQRVWVDHTKSNDQSGGTWNAASLRNFGVEFDMGDVGGNANNCHIDRIDYLGGGGIALLVDAGTAPSPAVWDDFVTADEGNSSNRYGVVSTRDGVIFVNARLGIGDATATIFNDSNFALTFVDAQLCASDFMGITVDLQNASTDVDFTGGVIQSGGVATESEQGDFIVTGTSGDFTADGTAFINLRVVDLTSACTVDGCTFTTCGQIDAASAGTTSASMVGCTVADSAVAADGGAVFYDVNSDPDGELDDMTIAQGTAAHHALHFGTSIPSSITLRGIEFTGFSSSDDVNGSTLRFDDTSGTITVNLIDCTVDGAAASEANIGVDAPVGLTVNLVVSPVTTSIHVEDVNGTNIQNARVLVETAAAGSFPFEASVSIVQSAGTATVTHTSHGLATGDYVTIRGAQPDDYNKATQITVTGTNTYTYSIASGTSSPATGSPVASYAPIVGLTDVNGDIDSTKTWGGNQQIKGWVRKKNATSPFYKDGNITGTVNATTGFSATVVLQPDE